jgi:hypothetical protein
MSLILIVLVHSVAAAALGLLQLLPPLLQRLILPMVQANSLSALTLVLSLQFFFYQSKRYSNDCEKTFLLFQAKSMVFTKNKTKMNKAMQYNIQLSPSLTYLVLMKKIT